MDQLGGGRGDIQLADTSNLEQGLWVGWYLRSSIFPTGSIKSWWLTGLIDIDDNAIQPMIDRIIDLLLHCIWQWHYPCPYPLQGCEYHETDDRNDRHDYSEYSNYTFLFLHLRLPFQAATGQIRKGSL